MDYYSFLPSVRLALQPSKKILLLLLFSACTVSNHALAIDLQIKGIGSGSIENAVLFTSTTSGCPRQAISLGNINLSESQHIYDLPLSASLTQWWIIGNKEGNVIYSSSNAKVDAQELEHDAPFSEVGTDSTAL